MFKIYWLFCIVFIFIEVIKLFLSKSSNKATLRRPHSFILFLCRNNIFSNNLKPIDIITPI